MLQVAEAFDKAKDLHKGQYRKGGDIPYWTHLRDVAALVKNHGGSLEQIVAGLFHDAIEDQNVTQSWIAQTAGDEVARMVSECSKGKIKDWDKRFEDYIQRLAACSVDTRLVVLADKVANLTDIKKDFDIIGDKLWSRFTKGPNTLRIQYTKYAEVFDSWGRLPNQWEKLRETYKIILKDLLEV